MWKVIVFFNEKPWEGEGVDDELSVVTEKIFDSYFDMRNYVTTCEGQGAVGGMVLKYHPKLDIWSYYMEVC